MDTKAKKKKKHFQMPSSQLSNLKNYYVKIKVGYMFQPLTWSSSGLNTKVKKRRYATEISFAITNLGNYCAYSMVGA
jgi:hypothetical protein